MKFKSHLPLFVALFISLPVLAQKTYIHAGQIFDAAKGKMIKNKTLVIEGKKITNVLDGWVAAENPTDNTLDLKTKTVLPGLIDMHIHIESEYTPQAYMGKYKDDDADRAFDAAQNAQRTLMAGFTTVRDMGGTGVNIALRDAIAQGKVPGPRIFSAEKAIGTTGGHADPTNGSRKELMGDPGPRDGVINSPDEAREAVRHRYKNGADCIKITATGGVTSVAKNGQNPQFTYEEIKAIVDTATDYGMHVAAHAHGDEGMYRAVLAGVKTIEHGTLVSERTMELMKEKQTYLVATISAGKHVAKMAKIKGFFPEIIVPKAIAIGPQIQATFGRAYKTGVPIAFGTDAGVFPHGENAQEFVYMVEAGMPEHEALQHAMITNAKLLGVADELGQLLPGYTADIIAVGQNPLDDITTLQNVSFVMKEGQVYKNN